MRLYPRNLRRWNDLGRRHMRVPLLPTNMQSRNRVELGALQMCLLWQNLPRGLLLRYVNLQLPLHLARLRRRSIRLPDLPVRLRATELR